MYKVRIEKKGMYLHALIELCTVKICTNRKKKKKRRRTTRRMFKSHLYIHIYIYTYTYHKFHTPLLPIALQNLFVSPTPSFRPFFFSPQRTRVISPTPSILSSSLFQPLPSSSPSNRTAQQLQGVEKRRRRRRMMQALTTSVTIDRSIE